MRQRPDYRGWIRLFAVLTILSAVQSAPAQKPASTIDYDALVTTVDEMSQKLEVLSDAVDQTRFDPEEWLDNLDYDAGSVLLAVSEQIDFQPYAGVLRGVSGTLRARAGNSLDQALLLASLLKSAGYDARITRGVLDDAEAGRLLSTVGGGSGKKTLSYLGPIIQAQYGALAAKGPADIVWNDLALSKRSSAAADILLESLSGAGVKFEPRDITKKSLAVTRDYFWVQYREGPADSWADAHPAFGKQKPPGNVAAEEYFSESIPEKYQHRLTISASLNQRQLDTVTTHQLMTPYARPVANLHGISISYRNHPNGLSLENVADIGKAMDSSQFLMPTFNGAPAPGAMAFDLQGRVIDPLVAGSTGAGLFATLASAMEEATGDVTDRDDSEPVFALDSMWLDFRFSSPDGTEISYRRYILPPQNGRNTKPAELLWPLITDHSYMVNSGRQPLDYIAARYLAAGISGNTWYKALIHKHTNPKAGTPMPADQPPRDFALLTQYHLMDANPMGSATGSASAFAFRSEPGLLGIRRGFRDANTAFIGIDVVANAMLHVKYANGKLWQDPQAALRRGVWDTSTEVVPARSMDIDAVQSSNAVDIFARASEQAIDLKTIRPGHVEALDSLNLDSSTMLSVRADLDNGYSVIIPARTPDGEAMNGWWRVNLETGETLGMTADGYGAEVVEYLTQLTDVALGLVNALNSLNACAKMDNDVAHMCCLVEANINNVAGLGFGGVIGAMGGTAGGALFSIVDFGLQAATEAAFGTAQGMMPTASLGCKDMQATSW
jgi:hypothetical protein